MDATKKKELRGSKLSERAFQSQVIGLAKLCGWKVYHTHDSRRSAPGFPGLILIKGPRLLALELKNETGRIRPEQKDWIEAFGQVTNVHSAIYRPDDWDEIQTLLTEQPSRVSKSATSAAGCLANRGGRWQSA